MIYYILSILTGAASMFLLIRWICMRGYNMSRGKVGAAYLARLENLMVITETQKLLKEEDS